MRNHRIGQVVALVASLALTGCGAGTRATVEQVGTVQARIHATPASVRSVLILVTGPAPDYTPLGSAPMIADAGGSWSGRVVNVAPGLGRVITVYAFDTDVIPADPKADPVAIVYWGQRTNVMVTAGQLTAVQVTMLPWNDGGGETGINTPPHFTASSHPDAAAAGAPATFQATASDPDVTDTLTYTWRDDAGGTFAGGDVADPARFSNREPGVPVAVDYSPPPDFVGTVTITVEATDGTATATDSFRLAVGSGVTVDAFFIEVPTVTLAPRADPALQVGQELAIDYRLAVPVDGAAVGNTPWVVAWSDSCGGTFGGNFEKFPFLPQGTQLDQTAIYRAPAVAPPAGTACELRLTLTQPDAMVTAWTSLLAWVDPTVSGYWEGTTELGGSPYSVSMGLLQAGATVSGTFTGGGVDEGIVTGSLAAQTISLTIELTSVACPGRITAVGAMNAAGTELTLDYTGTLACQGNVASTMTLTRLPPRVVFVTSTTSDGVLGGLAGADARCQARADLGISWGVLPAGTYRAFLTTTTTSVVDRLPDGSWALPDGTLVAVSRADLLDGAILHTIDMDEIGQPAGWPGWVWTGTNEFGQIADAYETCGDWTSSDPDGRGIAGSAIETSWYWTRILQHQCSQQAALYCLQQ